MDSINLTMTQDQLQELQVLTRTFEVLRNTDLGAAIQILIQNLLETSSGISFEEPCTDNPFTCKREDCCQRVNAADLSPEMYAALMSQSEELSDELLDELEEDEMPYVDYDTVITTIGANRGLRAARAGWDNGLNQEYIEHAPFVGPVKVFHTSTIRDIDKGSGHPYFKNVIHTFEATRDDKTANDWYFL